jgi:hypothetical protein
MARRRTADPWFAEYRESLLTAPAWPLIFIYWKIGQRY